MGVPPITTLESSAPCWACKAPPVPSPVYCCLLSLPTCCSLPRATPQPDPLPDPSVWLNPKLKPALPTLSAPPPPGAGPALPGQETLRKGPHRLSKSRYISLRGHRWISQAQGTRQRARSFLCEKQIWSFTRTRQTNRQITKGIPSGFKMNEKGLQEKQSHRQSSQQYAQSWGTERFISEAALWQCLAKQPQPSMSSIVKVPHGFTG